MRPAWRTRPDDPDAFLADDLFRRPVLVAGRGGRDRLRHL